MCVCSSSRRHFSQRHNRTGGLCEFVEGKPKNEKQTNSKTHQTAPLALAELEITSQFPGRILISAANSSFPLIPASQKQLLNHPSVFTAHYPIQQNRSPKKTMLFLVKNGFRASSRFRSLDVSISRANT